MFNPPIDPALEAPSVDEKIFKLKRNFYAKLIPRLWIRGSYKIAKIAYLSNLYLKKTATNQLFATVKMRK